MSSGPAEAAPVHGHAAGARVAESIRRTLRHAPGARTLERVCRELRVLRAPLARHFEADLREVDAAQFLRYRVGDFFVAHQEGNTGMLRLPSEVRRISVVVFLSTQSPVPGAGAYAGGTLVFHEWRTGQSLRFPGELGTLVAFRAETTHEVTQVTQGERCTIAGWYR